MGTRLIAPHSLPGIYSDKIQLESGRIEYFCLSDFRERETNNLIDIFLMSPTRGSKWLSKSGISYKRKAEQKAYKDLALIFYEWRKGKFFGEFEAYLDTYALGPVLVGKDGRIDFSAKDDSKVVEMWGPSFTYKVEIVGTTGDLLVGEGINGFGDDGGIMDKIRLTQIEEPGLIYVDGMPKPGTIKEWQFVK